MAKQFASKGDLAPKQVTFEELTPQAWVYSAEGDPTSGVIIGDDAVMVVDTRSTPVAAEDLIRRIRGVTDKPIEYVLLSHYHAVRVLGASTYNAKYIIASEATRELIEERGAQDYKSEVERFPRLFEGVESVPGLTWPNVTFNERMTLWIGSLEVQIMHLGRGHTRGDTVAWLPKQKVLFSGDLVEHGATPYTGDAYLADWPHTLQRVRALEPEFLVPGRGGACRGAAECEGAISQTQSFVTALYDTVADGVAQGASLKDVYDRTVDRLRPQFGDWSIFDHCMPFDVSRCYDEVTGTENPRIWTAERDMEMWQALEGGN